MCGRRVVLSFKWEQHKAKNPKGEEISGSTHPHLQYAVATSFFDDLSHVNCYQ